MRLDVIQTMIANTNVRVSNIYKIKGTEDKLLIKMIQSGIESTLYFLNFRNNITQFSFFGY